MNQSKTIILGIALCFALSMQASFAEEVETKVVTLDEMYEKGNEAYKSKDYLTALKYLFAYRAVNEEKLSEHTEFSDQLNEAIATSESYILEAIKFREKFVRRESEFQGSFRGIGR